MIIWLTLFLDLQKELKRYVIKPLEQLAVRTKALTVGDFSKVNILSPIPTGFVELNKLLLDFQFMTSTLQIRETALRESENRYRGLVERLPIGLFQTKLTGEILDINPTASFILGYPNIENLLKINIVKILNTYSIDNEQEKFSIENIRDLNKYETQIQCYDGKIMWVQISSQIAYDNKYEVGFIEGSIINITERKETEAKIKVQQELLIESEKEKREVLEKALIMKDEFISLISHEFKTPLNVIYSAVQLIESVYFNKIPERVQELMGNIKQNTFRQLRLSNNLLDITRMNSGITKLNRRNVDIVFLSKVITQSVEPYTNQKNIKIAFKSNLSSKIISIDEEKYERIILNILSNAMKFTESGGEITVTLNENKKSNCVQIKIADTGIGIPEDKQDIIFERFGQVDSNLSRQAEGTGIGLSLVKLLVNILEGTIKVESKLGMGSTFIISFPIKKEVVDSYSEVCFDVENRLVSETKVEFSDIYL
jgi:PAS domain S-box-containing protein